MPVGRRHVGTLCLALCGVLVLVLSFGSPAQCPSGGACSETEAEQHSLDSDTELGTSILQVKSTSRPDSSEGNAGQPVKLQEMSDPSSYEALVHKPHGTGPFPLLLYLHGAGEQGGVLQDILSEGATGTPPVALTTGQALPILVTKFVVVAPHTSSGWDPSTISRFLDFLLLERNNLSLDKDRLYVTGHSMGGYGALAAATTGRFAAAVPVAGAGAPSLEKLRGVPIWAFHGRNDVIVPSDYTEELISRLRQMGASEDNVKITLYDNAPAPPGWPDYYGHASTIPAYATPGLYDWLLAHSLRH